MSDVILVSDPFLAGASASGTFGNLPVATLQQYLADAQDVLHRIVIGAKEVTVAYGEGSGQKSVTYQRTDEQRLRMHVAELKQLLGLSPGRRPLRLAF